jgi:hypothetical protein
MTPCWLRICRIEEPLYIAKRAADLGGYDRVPGRTPFLPRRIDPALNDPEFDKSERPCYHRACKDVS